MIVTFTSKAGSSVTMFGDIAVQLLKLMGHSGTVPGAVRPEDIPAAVHALEAALQRHVGVAAEPVAPMSNDSDQEPAVSLATRARPLLDLLRASAAAGCHVMWDK